MNVLETLIDMLGGWVVSNWMINAMDNVILLRVKMRYFF
jgi:hypothetical protein